jgi:hypothetical protein
LLSMCQSNDSYECNFTVLGYVLDALSTYEHMLLTETSLTSRRICRQTVLKGF